VGSGGSDNWIRASRRPRRGHDRGIELTHFGWPRSSNKVGGGRKSKGARAALPGQTGSQYARPGTESYPANAGPSDRRVPTARESAALGTLLAFILRLNSGNLSSKFQNILLFTAYWIAPFLAIIVIDWYRRGGSISREGLARLMRFTNLSTGWPALAALVVGFAAMVRFMDTGLIVGPVAGALHGADLSFYVGFLVAALVYSALSRFGALREAGRAA
jgi:hypothetical protein